jgi:hypothetical protein
MALAREDKRFVAGLTLAVAVLGLYSVAVRGPFRSAIGRHEREARALQPKIAPHFRNPKATPFPRVQHELTKRSDDLAEQLARLVAAVEFDPGPLDPAGREAGPGADATVLYHRLSGELHGRVEAAAQKASPQVAVPRVFDPQGRISTPRDPARVPRLHRQLAMAYHILLAAIAHGVDIVDLRAPQVGLGDAREQAYLEELGVTVTASGDVDAFAAFVHALSQPPSGGGGSKLLSIRRLDIRAADGDGGKIGYEVTFVSVRTDPKATLAGEGAGAPGVPPRRRRPVRRAPRF